MAKKKFLDYDGVLYLWEKVKAAIAAAKVTKTSELTNDSNFLTEHQAIPDGSTSAKGLVQLSSATNSTSTSLAATASAVKAAYDLADGKASKATTLSGYGITDAYTRTEIDNKLSASMTYQGSVDAFTDLPAKPNKGDVYNIKTAGGTGADGTAVKAGDNVAWNGTGWDVLGGAIDLSGYVESSDRITNDDIDKITK